MLSIRCKLYPSLTLKEILENEDFFWDEGSAEKSYQSDTHLMVLHSERHLANINLNPLKRPQSPFLDWINRILAHSLTIWVAIYSSLTKSLFSRTKWIPNESKRMNLNKFDHPRFYQWFLWLSEKELFKFKIVVFYLETNINDFEVWN